DEGKHFGALRGRNLETVQGRLNMADEAAPIGFADPHAAMGGLHVAADIEQGPAGRSAEEVDEQLLLPADAVLAAMGPVTAELFVDLQASHQLVGHGGDRIVTAEAHVQWVRPLPLPDLCGCHPKALAPS